MVTQKWEIGSQLVSISVAMKHAYVVTDKIPGIENMPNIRDHDLSVYLKLQVI